MKWIETIITPYHQPPNTKVTLTGIYEDQAAKWILTVNDNGHVTKRTVFIKRIKSMVVESPTIEELADKYMRQHEKLVNRYNKIWWIFIHTN